ncbi:23S rRNA pseudouridine955/2504/2580 synthase [Acetitomaculum ruminis DSM 5522]|uniref:RNA pseudouridylate synthase n=1 Tax=Acetitomaculum ruminis DSM 5522 TaxID=1120918 RepID=A0A1I0V9F1_9FIRM|nr:RluA family pseudouridine synthase [Acetitomaculum ruminis]SFA72955.1 23S rRNA pseudouridine955/2504/2580 synthase [Acetitomaculum ruminis DSM 5522]
MQKREIKENESGIRFDKFLGKYLCNAPASFIFKMLRKKNITLNGKKANGKEILKVNDEVNFYLSDETLEKFSKKEIQLPDKISSEISVIYEDKDILLINKPAGVLSQKANKDDISINEQALAYLLETKAIKITDLDTFMPSIANRLDKNTTGLITYGKTIKGLQFLNKCFKDRSIKKYYRTICYGKLTKALHIKGYLTKDEKNNKVQISDKESKNSSYIETSIEVLEYNDNYSYLEVELITGKSHQIRAHLASIGHPLLGEKKYIYTDISKRDKYRYQLLHSYKMIFPEIEDDYFSYLSNKEFTAPLNKKLLNAKKELFK